MLKTFDEVSALITGGKLLHVAGSEALLKKLPAGTWIGGSTEYFMDCEGGKVSGEHLFVTEFPYERFSIRHYSEKDIANVADDAFENGFSIVILPFDSAVHQEYAQNAASFEGMFMKNMTGWVSGFRLGTAGQTPIAVDGQAGVAYHDQAVALHLETPADLTVSINIINIFAQDEDSPVIEFTEEGFSAGTCLVDGRQVVLADYIAEHHIDTKFPMVGDYSGNGVNISIKSIENGVVHFYAPVFSGIRYKMARSISDYEHAFNSRLSGLKNSRAIFSCNCILNFLYGELEGKKIETFTGPITFGEIAYQLLNQTLVYVTVE